MSGYLVSASGLTSRISERFVVGQMSNKLGAECRLCVPSVCSDCFSDKHLFGVARSHFKSTNVQRDTSTNGLVAGLFFGHFFGEWRKFLAHGRGTLQERCWTTTWTLLKSVCC